MATIYTQHANQRRAIVKDSRRAPLYQSQIHVRLNGQSDNLYTTTCKQCATLFLQKPNAIMHRRRYLSKDNLKSILTLFGYQSEDEFFAEVKRKYKTTENLRIRLIKW